MSNLLQESKNLQQDLVRWRRDLHKIPETEFELPQTTAYIEAELSKMQIPYKTGIGYSGIVGLIEGQPGGKTIGLRADMDALPIKENTGLEYASTNDNMHACGHDAHAAMLLGTAKLLNSMRHAFRGNVKLIFQPAEEVPGGAKPMIQDGVLEEPKVDAILGLHVGNIVKGLEYGKVAVKHDAAMAASDIIKLIIKGTGCHGSAPYAGADPITMAGHVITALQNIISRETKATEPVVMSFGKIAGGDVFNVIPEEVELHGMVRTFSHERREYVSRRFEEIVASVTKGLKGDYWLDYFFSYPPLINDRAFTDTFIESAKKVLNEEEIIVMEEPVMGAEDMAYFLEQVPGTFFFLGTDNPEKGIVHPNHSSKFNVDEDVLWRGPALLGQASLDWLNNH